MAKRHEHFHFKHFAIDHSSAVMKVGTDAVLLGAWVDVSGSADILDIGTGSGVIALMLAQRATDSAFIDAVEIDVSDATLATENVAKSPWPTKVAVHHTAIQNYNSHRRYDLIVSNPPFFSNSYAPPDARRYKVRHTHELPFEELVRHVLRLLRPGGKFAVVLPTTEADQLMGLCKNQLFCIRTRAFRARQEKPVERRLLEFKKEPGPLTVEPELILYNDDDQWSDDYRTLTKDFYLKA